jgi:hypothetical protein
MHSQKTYLFPYFIIFSEKNQLICQKNEKKRKNNRLKIGWYYAIMKGQMRALIQKMPENTRNTAPRGICYIITNAILIFKKIKKMPSGGI